MAIEEIVRKYGRTLKLRIGWTASTNVLRHYMTQSERLFGLQVPKSRLEIHRQSLVYSDEEIVSKALSRGHIETGYDGLALFRILASSARYEEAIKVRNLSLEILANDRRRFMPRDHVRVNHICRGWLGKVESLRDPNSNQIPVPIPSLESLPWVIIGPKCSPVDISNLRFERFTAVSLNRPLPNWIPECPQKYLSEIVFLNHYDGGNLLAHQTDLPFLDLNGSPQTIYFKNPSHAMQFAAYGSMHSAFTKAATAVNIEEHYVNGSANMLPIALATAAAIGVSSLFALGFDLYSDAKGMSPEPCSDEDFDRRGNFLTHDQLEQRDVLRLLFEQNGYHADSHMATALGFSDVELLTRVGGVR